jgi:hypothetical protein
MDQVILVTGLVGRLEIGTGSGKFEGSNIGTGFAHMNFQGSNRTCLTLIMKTVYTRNYATILASMLTPNTVAGSNPNCRGRAFLP